jgi:hypothetical protein
LTVQLSIEIGETLTVRDADGIATVSRESWIGVGRRAGRHGFAGFGDREMRVLGSLDGLRGDAEAGSTKRRGGLGGG